MYVYDPDAKEGPPNQGKHCKKRSVHVRAEDTSPGRIKKKGRVSTLPYQSGEAFLANIKLRIQNEGVIWCDRFGTQSL